MARFDPNDDGLNESQPTGSIPDFDDDELDVLLDEFRDAPQDDELDPITFAEDEVS